MAQHDRDGAATPSFAGSVDSATQPQPRCLAVADLNGDGKADVAVASLGSNNGLSNGGPSVFLNTTATGAASPTFAAKLDFAAGAQLSGVAIADLNGDGKPDLAATNVSSNSVSVLLAVMRLRLGWRVRLSVAERTPMLAPVLSRLAFWRLRESLVGCTERSSSACS